MSGRRDIVHSKEALELKVATRGLIRAAGGTDGAGETAGARQQRMSDCQCPHTPDFLRIDETAALEDVTVGQAGWPHVTRALAKRQGFALVRLPTAATGSTQWHEAIGAVSKEVGEAVGLVCEGLADAETPGAITAAEVRDKRIIENIDEAIEKLVALRALALSAPEEGR